MSYAPKYHHAIVTIVLCVICMLLGARYQRYASAFNIGALGLAILTATIIALIVLESLNERVRVMTYWMDAFAKLDDEGRAAVAFEFPSMRYKMKRGVVRGYFEDTNVPIDMFRLFLQTSNDRYISPLRDWCTKDMPEWAHNEIRIWLEDHEKVIRDSAAGSHSWLWSGSSYQHLMAYWMSGRKLTETRDEQVMSEGVRQYAYEEEEPKLA